MEKLKQHKEVVIIIAVILGFVFYWFQLRPTSIKKECSWASGALGLTYEAYQLGKIQTPEEYLANPQKVSLQPDKEVTRPATKAEYDLCLRQNGL